MHYPPSAGVGAYRTEELQPYVLNVVRKASSQLQTWLAGQPAADRLCSC